MHDEQPPYNPLHLDNMLCFVIYAASREMTRLYRPVLEELGLTYPQYLVMVVLWEEQSVTVKQLGDRLFLDSGTLTPLLKRLEASGLVARERSREDERLVVISLTDAGRALHERAIAVPEQVLCKSGLQPDEFIRLQQEFRDLLHRVRAFGDATE